MTKPRSYVRRQREATDRLRDSHGADVVKKQGAPDATRGAAPQGPGQENKRGDALPIPKPPNHAQLAEANRQLAWNYGIPCVCGHAGTDHQWYDDPNRTDCILCPTLGESCEAYQPEETDR